MLINNKKFIININSIDWIGINHFLNNSYVFRFFFFSYGSTISIQYLDWN